jgi:fructokinase
MRIGIDLGGTKTEAIALDEGGAELLRQRVSTPRNYAGTVGAIRDLVLEVEAKLGQQGTVGVGMPGVLSPQTGLVKNANSTWLIGKPFDVDLSAALERPVRCENDANCLAVSEGTDGAGAGKHLVFGVIIGTGCGGGIAIDGRAHRGGNGVGGEWGHNPLPWPRDDERPGPACYCGKSGCLETWISGTGFGKDHVRVTGQEISTHEVVARAEAGDPDASATLERYISRLTRGLAHVVNLLDPDVIVLGGGMSNVQALYDRLPAAIASNVFSDVFETPIRPARHGDSSGVRGAARLWPLEAER